MTKRVEVGRALGPRFRSTFIAEVTFMEGDADGYHIEEVTLNGQEEVIEFSDLIDFLRSHRDFARLGEHAYGDDRVFEVKRQIWGNPLFQKYFIGGITEEDWRADRYTQSTTFLDYLIDDCSVDPWPYEREDGGPMSLDRVQYFFYDDVGLKYPVTIRTT